ncbi:hypothetical protein T11_2207 [Trichinella zimbabwensis]|uniref:Uncharacterized protein n=1 Tax=Trichinella zimbabwensis TaxID=268475 RepID=A0A0V1GBY5_9BILA|nr:hypothetical protein T11_2207 [Trichinella zimbabwensis]
MLYYLVTEMICGVTIEFGCRKDLTFQCKRAQTNKVRQNLLDTSFCEAHSFCSPLEPTSI